MIAEIKERDIGAVKVGQDASFSVLAYPGETVSRKVVRIANQVETESRTVEVRIEVSNADTRLKPGMFADIEITTTVLTRHYRHSGCALQTDEENQIVFVALDANKFQKRARETRDGAARSRASRRWFEGRREDRDRRRLHLEIRNAERRTRRGIAVINAILSFSVRQRMIVVLAAVILTGFGILALKQIPIDAFPDVTNVQVQVLATAGGMSPPEVEKLVTRPIEIQMGGSATSD